MRRAHGDDDRPRFDQRQDARIGKICDGDLRSSRKQFIRRKRRRQPDDGEPRALRRAETRERVLERNRAAGLGAQLRQRGLVGQRIGLGARERGASSGQPSS